MTRRRKAQTILIHTARRQLDLSDPLYRMVRRAVAGALREKLFALHNLLTATR